MPENAKEIITRKIGPLPVWGWVAAIAGGVFVFRMMTGGDSQPAETYPPISTDIPADEEARLTIDEMLSLVRAWQQGSGNTGNSPGVPQPVPTDENGNPIDASLIVPPRPPDPARAIRVPQTTMFGRTPTGIY